MKVSAVGLLTWMLWVGRVAYRMGVLVLTRPWWVATATDRLGVGWTIRAIRNADLICLWNILGRSLGLASGMLMRLLDDRCI